MQLEGSSQPEVEQQQQQKEVAASAASPCSICFDHVVDCGDRSIAKLHCGHEFHLDCIGSAFNAKGAMQCPNCRKVEKGRWLYANGHRSPGEFDFEGWVTEDIIDLNYPEQFGFPWCPIRGFPQLTSLLEEGDFLPNSYHDLMGATFGDHSSASSSAPPMCPYLAMHGFPHTLLATPPNPDPIPDGARFHRHHAAGLGGQSSADMINLQNYPTIEPHNHNWQQRPSHLFPASNSEPLAAINLTSMLSRNDSSNQRRSGRSGSNMVTSVGTPAMGDRHSRRHAGHIYQQSVVPALHGGSHFHPVRRPGPRGGAAGSSMATLSTVEVGGAGMYGVSVSGSISRNAQDSDIIGRHFDGMYGWPGREGGYPPLPWIHVDGESQWWGPFNPSQNGQQPGGSSDAVTRNFFPQRPTLERATQSRQDNSYLQMPPPRLPPFQ